jgi:PAS domain-containing protein
LHRWYDVYAWSYGDPQDMQVAILNNDITERKRAEEALRVSERRFRAFTEATSDVAYRMSPDWCEILFPSPRSPFSLKDKINLLHENKGNVVSQMRRLHGLWRNLVGNEYRGMPLSISLPVNSCRMGGVQRNPSVLRFAGMFNRWNRWVALRSTHPTKLPEFVQR